MTAEEQLPSYVRTAWGLGPEARRGRPAELSLDQIVAAATRLADDGGLAAVSMASVAKALGYSTMSLYRHVGSKDELLELMVDEVFSRPPAAGADDWRAGLKQWAAMLMDEMRAHGWILDVPVSGPPMMPKALAWMDWALGVLADEPLIPLEKLSVLMLVNGYARNEVSLARGLERSRERRGITTDEEAVEYATGLTELVARAPLPHLSAVVREGLFDVSGSSDGVDDEDAFMVDFGLERILDGIEALIDKRRAAPS
ncbi:putative TetR family transcriptional regulator [Gordonia araii NBRC 100433]|uniref:Putative TetR family transcriptional regulator n=1 Tax=Gordonia araii NBRC 100433 TaxID=1073574 RepID=G7H1U8_9ACTN|nr:TetR/AcrR family transcriptional regulator [Gordonia araii]NNG97157.1 TetR/AcrR family transcriptional regulator [Gordonia araii NBRC 100433]GAB09823.1 putative TetR family transcriptional regulator [Gordonia araii NBRC 100433]